MSLASDFVNGSLAIPSCVRRVSNVGVLTRCLGLLCLFACTCQLWCSSISAQEPLLSHSVDAHLSAGEFEAAIELVRERPRQERDAFLAHIATAQAQKGMVRAAFVTMTSIQSDTELQAATRRIASIGRGDSLVDSGIDPRGDSRSPTTSDAAGGGSQADFTALIDVIQSTVEPDSWEEVGGPGAIVEFPGGVYVDAAGELKRLSKQRARDRGDGETASVGRDLLGLIRRESEESWAATPTNLASGLRKISLPRLERALQVRHLAGLPANESMQSLAGLRDVQYVFVYPETNDLVIAGSAAPWQRDADGRFVDDAGDPLMQLDDLVVLLRNAFDAGGRFGCSIDPRPANLATTQDFLHSTLDRPFRSTSQRTRWLNQLRDAVGQQDIIVRGVDPGSHVARVIVEADYHMKLVGMGLEPAVAGTRSYLNLIELQPNEAPPAMTLLRWWFTLNYDSLATNETKTAFALRGPGVKLLSENEMLAARGQRVATGKSDPWNQAFASNFTEHYLAFCERYPIYRELKQVFDLALVAGLINTHRLHDEAHWSASYLRSTAGYRVAAGRSPREVASVVNHRVINGRQVIAGVSGGVTVQTSLLTTNYDDGNASVLTSHADREKPQAEDVGWWWD